jgi:addiction module RelE/StbE family toxin
VNQIIWAPQAIDDLRQIRTYLDETAPHMTRDTFQMIVRRVKQLRDFPDSGPRVGRTGLRKLSIAGLPYILIYRAGSRGPEIVAVRHSSQNWLRDL